VLAILVVATGCRFGFESRAPASVDDAAGDGAQADGPGADAISCTHDEDGDGVLDCVDVCPHIADATQQDSDSDGVGDICDPDLGGANQILAFVAFTEAGSLVLTGDDTLQETGEKLHLDGTGRTVGVLAVPVGNVDVVIGGRINSVPSSGERQLAIFPDPGSNQPFFYSDIYQLTGSASVHVAQYTGATYTPIDSTNLGSIPTGAFSLKMHARATQMTTTLATAQTAVANATVAYTGSSSLTFVFSLLDVDIEYIAVIGAP